MPSITFGTVSAPDLQGSGLGFFGNTFGSSVQIGSYQTKTFITNSTGSTNGGNAYNVKYGNHPATGISEYVNSGIPLVRMNGYYRTLDIHFDHTTEVNVQNAQLRIYDRSNINYPASGVNTKVAEIINFGGQTYSAWLSAPGDGNTITCHGSGDLFWWGDPWPAANVTRNYYQNSVGTRFYNGTTSDSVTNGDSRLASITGGDDTVGGTGIVVPLVNSPGSGGKFLNQQFQVGTQKFVPKWRQYYNPSALLNVPNIGTAGEENVGGGDNYQTYGGTGIDRRHTWRVALSATPLSIGSKEQYGVYVSLEYL